MTTMMATIISYLAEGVEERRQFGACVGAVLVGVGGAAARTARQRVRCWTHVAVTTVVRRPTALLRFHRLGHATPTHRPLIRINPRPAFSRLKPTSSGG